MSIIRPTWATANYSPLSSRPKPWTRVIFLGARVIFLGLALFSLGLALFSLGSRYFLNHAISYVGPNGLRPFRIHLTSCVPQSTCPLVMCFVRTAMVSELA